MVNPAQYIKNNLDLVFTFYEVVTHYFIPEIRTKYQFSPTHYRLNVDCHFSIVSIVLSNKLNDRRFS